MLDVYFEVFDLLYPGGDVANFKQKDTQTRRKDKPERTAAGRIFPVLRIIYLFRTGLMSLIRNWVVTVPR